MSENHYEATENIHCHIIMCQQLKHRLVIFVELHVPMWKALDHGEPEQAPPWLEVLCCTWHICQACRQPFRAWGSLSLGCHAGLALRCALCTQLSGGMLPQINLLSEGVSEAF